MGYFYFISILLLSEAASAATPSVRYQKDTFHEIYLKSPGNSPCTDQLRKFYQSGNIFFSPTVKKFTQSEKDFNFSGLERGQVFYHYTPSLAVQRIADKNKVFEIFDYLRRPKDPLRNRNPFLYVADDAVSSEDYGAYQIKLYLKDGFSVLKELAISEDSTRAEKIVTREALINHSEISECNEPIELEILYFLILEDMSVDLIQYGGNVGHGHWFRLFNPYAVKKIEAYR